ncbi:MAG: ankyrin repeat domain-containing protein [Armatimonadetes bacterium]|nr:ankyrin repeat domain-containing protein [Armatimonadota bacterium]
MTVRALRICGAGVAVLFTGLYATPQSVRVFDPNDPGNLLNEAVRAGDLTRVRELLRQGADPNAEFSNGWTPILRAVYVEDQEVAYQIVDLLLQAGANVNHKQPGQGWTALHSATATNIAQIRIVQLLLDHGSDVNAAMNDGSTSLHLAARWDRLDVAKLLMEHGADIEARLQEPPEIAPSALPEDLARFLDEDLREMKERFRVQRQEERSEMDRMYEKGYSAVGRTPLIVSAVSRSSLEMFTLLFDHGAELAARDRIGRTALHEAARMGDIRIVEFLIARGADVSAMSKNGYTPLHAAARSGSLAVAKRLLETDADPNARTADGLTPMQLLRQDWEWLQKMFDEAEARLGQSLDADRDTMMMMDAAREHIHEMEQLLLSYGAVGERIGEGGAVIRWIGYAALGVIVLVAGSVVVVLRRFARRTT